MDKIDNYLKVAGQTLQYLMSGAMEYGTAFIIELVDTALAQNKKIVWETRLIDGQDLGLCDYYLEAIK